MAVTSGDAPRATGLSLLAIVAAFAAFLSIMTLHVVRTDLDPVTRVMSEYANGSHGAAMTVAFYALGVACVALALRLPRAVRWCGAMRWVIPLLAFAGVALVLSGVFEVGPPLVPDTVEESVHSSASIAAFVALISTMLLFSYAAGRDPAWRTFGWVSWPLALLAAAAGSASPLVNGPEGAGVVQRVLGGSVLLWLLLVARRIRTNAFAAHA